MKSLSVLSKHPMFMTHVVNDHDIKIDKGLLAKLKVKLGGRVFSNLQKLREEIYNTAQLKVSDDMADAIKDQIATKPNKESRDLTPEERVALVMHYYKGKSLPSHRDLALKIRVAFNVAISDRYIQCNRYEKLYLPSKAQAKIDDFRKVVDAASIIANMKGDPSTTEVRKPSPKLA